ncbi:DUF2971 domain-containing protein [Uliginosibacterium sp. H1]|uniref:DUF2971 domain-containing protein n=1 Tax=Uliginosibacterium sp. H1 TaxID=3114757 RepID=UPI002E16DD24|nr:DUF2971 domain-containing protein [Uliginosibacterium sp. H1]
MSILYHYTSVEAFLGIVQSRSLWLSGHTSMNDTHEGKWVDDLLQEALSASSELDEEEKAEISACYHRAKAELLLFSMSDQPDVLSQWRAYGNDGRGVAMGINRDVVERAEGPRDVPPSVLADTWLGKVIYDRDEQIRQIRRWIDPPDKRYRLMPKAFLLPDINGRMLAHLNALFKNPAFDEEAEHRLVLPLHAGRAYELVDDMPQFNYPLRQRAARGRIITFVEYPLLRDRRDVFGEIWLGPKCEIDEDEVALALHLNGYEVPEIRRSSATYR